MNLIFKDKPTKLDDQIIDVINIKRELFRFDIRKIRNNELF